MSIGLIIGGAENNLVEVEEALKLFKPTKIFCINDIGISYPKYDFWVSLHPENFIKQEWYKKRQELNLEIPKYIINHRKEQHTTNVVEYRWKECPGCGASGLYAVKVALEYGCDKVVLCGIPMTPTPHFFSNREWKEVRQFLLAWENNVDFLKKYVRSMSGYTKELLGYPDLDFLNEN